MEEDIIMENVNNELNRIIDYCLNKEEITATEYISIKRNLLLLFESEIEKVKRLTNKNKEITNHLDMAINEINVLRKEIKELEKMVELMAEEMDINCFHGSSYNDYCKKECDENCKKCIIDFFKKKASEEK